MKVKKLVGYQRLKESSGRVISTGIKPPLNFYGRLVKRG